MLYVSLLSTRFLWCIFKKKISCEYGREKKLQVIGLLNLIFGCSSHSNVVYKKYFFKNLATFIRKRLSWRLFLIKLWNEGFANVANDGHFIPSHLYLFTKHLIFVMLSGICPAFV